MNEMIIKEMSKDLNISEKQVQTVKEILFHLLQDIEKRRLEL